MGLFDDISNKNALSSRINKLNASIKAGYLELGTRYYNVFKDNPDPRFAELVKEIQSSYELIAETEKELAFARGVVICTNCNTECSKEINFCTSCGHRLEKPFVAQPVVSQPPTIHNSGATVLGNAQADVIRPATEIPVVNATVPEQIANVSESKTSPAQPADVERNETSASTDNAEAIEGETKAENAATEVPAFKFCTQCGTKAQGSAMFCTNCGNKFKN